MEKIDRKAFLKGTSRRQFIKGGAVAGVGGLAAGGLAFLGLNSIGKNLGDILIEADKEITALSLSIQDISGQLEREIAKDTERLKESYASGKFKRFEELGYTAPQDFTDIETVIQTSQQLREQYGLVERLTIAKDRLEAKIAGAYVKTTEAALDLDETVEAYEPGFIKRINDGIRKAAGMPAGEEGKQARKKAKEDLIAPAENLRRKLQALRQIYDTNRDNRTAEHKVLEALNGFIEKDPLSPEEKEFYELLKQEYQKGGSKGSLREFIMNYETFNERDELHSGLKAAIEETEKTYNSIKQARKYALTLQGYHKQGLELQEQIRGQTPEEFGRSIDQMQERYYTIGGGVAKVIGELKGMGYEIVTKQEQIDRGTFMRKYFKRFGNFWKPVRNWGSAGVGLAAIAGIGYLMHRGHKARTYEQAYNAVVDIHNRDVDEQNSKV